MSQISNRIYQAIQASNLSYGELARLTGIPKSALHRYATGETEKCPLPRLEAIANATGVSPAYLMGWEESSEDNISLFSLPGIEHIQWQRVPLVGSIACGEPVLAQENIEDYVQIAANIPCDFVLRCNGSSMEPRLYDGDIVMIRKQPDVLDGQIAAVLIDDEATLKHVYHLPNRTGVQLVADNPSVFPSRFYMGQEAAGIVILGLAVAYQRAIK